MQNRKNFRLFISSTFSDFKKEREVLQTKVFPYIREYASKHGYIFQPIDLRWGVSNEAQLDQKTLELCLNEVRACKTHMHPNFLIMIGDRYGWVPVPYAIEINEFEALLLHITHDEKERLFEWYKKDLNQLPTSYIIKERAAEFEKFEKWVVVEKTLRHILQTAVKKSELSKDKRRKYFLSATESEVEEGIIPYINYTKYQKKLLQDNSSLQEVDIQHIFGFFRTIDIKTQVATKFIGSDYEDATKFKKRISDELLKKNILLCNTKQIDQENLDEKYLLEFKNRTIEFLKLQVDAQKTQETKERLTPLEIELQAQKQFALNKRKNFLAQKELRKSVSNYIADETLQTLVIYGESGKGKSALMSKLIEEAEITKNKKVIYRFVSATPNSSTTKEILTSIFDELNIDILKNQNTETFEEFSKRINSEILNIKESVVIFIDAVDQLQNSDQFLWLPKKLPLHVKIIISALKDKKYPEHSKYLQTLKTKTDKLYLIPEFNKPKELLHSLLKAEDRKVDKFQEEYFLKQFDKVKTPLYASIAVQEMKNWKSGDITQLLADTQTGIIKEFINNLSEFSHHNIEFVNKVLSYIYASKDGLSENELLQLISTDKEFIKRMAPETWHENPNKELPLVHWSRLQTQLKPFLNSKTQDNEELIYFFHREFSDAINAFSVLKQEYEELIKATQTVIKLLQNSSFESNRYGKLYIILTSEYLLKYPNRDKQNIFSKFITEINAKEWKNDYLIYLNNYGLNSYLNNKMFHAVLYQESYLISIRLLNSNSSTLVDALNNLATTYKYQNRQSEAIVLEEESLLICKKLYAEDSKTWSSKYNITLNNLARSYYNKNRLKEAIELEETSLLISKEHYLSHPSLWVKEYTRTLINLARSYYNFNLLEKGIPLLEEALEIRKHYYKKDSKTWAGLYTIALNDLAFSYKELNYPLKSIPLEEEALLIRTKLYKQNPSRWPKDYTRSLNNLATSYKIQNRLMDAKELEEKSYQITKELYQSNSNRWAKDFTIALNNLASSYRQLGQVNRAIELETEALNISKELYSNDPSRWAEFYLRGLGELAISYKTIDEMNLAFSFEELSFKISKKLYEENPARWAKEFVNSLTNLATSYKITKEYTKAIELEKQALLITRESYKNSTKRWVLTYITSLVNLSDSYIKTNKLDKAMTLDLTALKIIEKEYPDNKERWLNIYKSLLQKLIAQSKNKTELLKTYNQRLLEITKL